VTQLATKFEVNGKAVEVAVEPRMTLADCLRHVLRLTGTHVGCEHGVCGACTVLLDGEAVRSCLMLAVQAEGSRVTTIEGLSNDDDLTPLQKSFRKHHALQCGFCTPGMITTAHALLSEEPDCDADRVREVLSGNLCRCTGYISIVEAVLDARSAYQKGGVIASLRVSPSASPRINSAKQSRSAERGCFGALGAPRNDDGEPR
jgi:carbon-monoxide dehydrogenase small subunit